MTTQTVHRPAGCIAACQYPAARHEHGCAAAWMDRRVIELTHTRKADLIRLVRDRARREGGRWLIGGPEVWSKDELISDVIRHEFPEVAR